MRRAGDRAGCPRARSCCGLGKDRARTRSDPKGPDDTVLDEPPRDPSVKRVPQMGATLAWWSQAGPSSRSPRGPRRTVPPRTSAAAMITRFLTMYCPSIVGA